MDISPYGLPMKKPNNPPGRAAMPVLFISLPRETASFSIPLKRATPRKSVRLALARRCSLVSFCPPPLCFRLTKLPSERVSDCDLCCSGCLRWQSRRLPPPEKPDSANSRRFHSAPLQSRQRTAPLARSFIPLHSTSGIIRDRPDESPLSCLMQ